jgi:hypothetical protein
MPRKITLLLAAFLVSGLGLQAASAADLGVYRYGGNGVGTFYTLGFWGEAFPYGYRWSLVRACTRYEPVDTARGVVMEKVWVCGDRRHYYR